MTTLQRSTSRTLHLRSRDSSGGGMSAGGAGAASSVRSASLSRANGANTSAYSRSVLRSGQPVVLRLEPAQHTSAEATSSNIESSKGPANTASGKPVSSQTLLRGAKVVQITHNGEAYQLRATRHGKLILTK